MRKIRRMESSAQRDLVLNAEPHIDVHFLFAFCDKKECFFVEAKTFDLMVTAVRERNDEEPSSLSELDRAYRIKNIPDTMKLMNYADFVMEKYPKGVDELPVVQWWEDELDDDTHCDSCRKEMKERSGAAK